MLLVFRVQQGAVVMLQQIRHVAHTSYHEIIDAHVLILWNLLVQFGDHQAIPIHKLTIVRLDFPVQQPQ